MAAGGPRPAELCLADEPSAWRALGFAVDEEGVVTLPGFRIQLLGRAKQPAGGAVSLGLAGLPGVGCSSGELDEADGVPIHRCDPVGESLSAHGNGVIGLDHLVVRTPDWRRTKGALAAVGLFPKRQTDVVRRGLVQVFYRAEGDHSPIIEMVGPVVPPKEGEAGHAEIWGLTFVSGDLDKTHAVLPKHTKPPWKAVQPGRRITTLRHGGELGVSLALAFMSPHVREDPLPADQREAAYVRNAREQEEELARRTGSKL
mmetsp:Transcript_75561/g.238900  ORF Transcript_75561/g.238900 Transcript_75561/m.238900 type:complete len:258 (-) Transcript_75561:191-964(-)